MKKPCAYVCNSCSEPGHAEPARFERLAGVSQSIVPGAVCATSRLATTPLAVTEVPEHRRHIPCRPLEPGRDGGLRALAELRREPTGCGKFGPGGMGARHCYGERKRCVGR